MLILNANCEFWVDRILELWFEKYSDMKIPYGTKLTILKGLDIISEDMMSDLRNINEIRNKFAHARDVYTDKFDEEIRDNVKKLNLYIKQENQIDHTHFPQLLKQFGVFFISTLQQRYDTLHTKLVLENHTLTTQGRDFHKNKEFAP